MRGKASGSPWKRVGENLVRYVPSGNIYAVFRVKGKKSPVRISLETSDLPTAKRLLPDKRREVIEETASPDLKLTVSELITRYKKTLGGLDTSTIQFRTHVAEQLDSSLGSSVVREVKPSDIEGWLGKQNQRGISKATYNEYLRVARHLFALAVRDNVIKASPAAHLKQKRRDTPIRATPTEEEFQKILKDIRSQKMNADAAESADFLEFEGLAGVGNSETAALKWKHVNFENEEITLFRNKTDSGYSIPMFPKLKEFLQKKLSRSSDKNPESNVFKIKNPKKALTNACKRLQVAHYTNRSFRRFFITRAIRKGVDVKTISKWQNHKDGGVLVLNTYSHVIAEHEKEMAKKLA